MGYLILLAPLLSISEIANPVLNTVNGLQKIQLVEKNGRSLDSPVGGRIGRLFGGDVGSSVATNFLHLRLFVTFVSDSSDLVDILFNLMRAPLGDVLGVLNSMDNSFPEVTLHNTLESMMALRAGVFVDKASHEQGAQIGTENMLVRLSDQGYYCHGSNMNTNAYGSVTNARRYCKDTARFMITNDLKITEASTVAAIALLTEAKTDMTKLSPERVMLTKEKLTKLVALSLLNKGDVLNKVFPDEGQATKPN